MTCEEILAAINEYVDGECAARRSARPWRNTWPSAVLVSLSSTTFVRPSHCTKQASRSSCPRNCMNGSARCSATAGVNDFLEREDRMGWKGFLVFLGRFAAWVHPATRWVLPMCGIETCCSSARQCSSCRCAATGCRSHESGQTESRRKTMTIERGLRGIAGTFAESASATLAAVHSLYWLLFTGFVGFGSCCSRHLQTGARWYGYWGD